ncbi:protein of unknown function [Legionella fallonii LLAP-10]|uniref:Uncharacterized protein n=1 Tax=Legionella fallonii LLAP-10 TaxID=1212491 RepID=A0A098G1R6_9GAMM|nr:protein of unknown function [Legionella fallonii LLAP-10]
MGLWFVSTALFVCSERAYLAHLERTAQQKNTHVPAVHSAFFAGPFSQPALKSDRSWSWWVFFCEWRFADSLFWSLCRT